MLAWDRELKKIITNQKKEENNDVITYEQFIKNNKLRDFTKK
jgi:hypothetical protein